jgi:putative peptide maturation system protein
MSDDLQRALAEVLDCLMDLVREGVRPEEARARLNQLQREHPATALDLVWEEEPYDGSTHYDVLLHRSGRGTVSLSFCPEGTLPWPLRGARPASERCLVKVNTTSMELDQALACLDFIWDEVRLLNRLVDSCLIQEAVSEVPLELSGRELQHALDSFRRAHRLYTAEETYRWMEHRGLSQAQLERLVGDQAMIARLRERVTAGRVEAYFEQHRAEFDAAWIARFEVADEAMARQLGEQIRRGEVDFYQAAQDAFVSTAAASTQPGRDLFGVVRRGQLTPALAALFSAAPGELVGPLQTETGYAIVRVLSLTPARLDEPLRRAIKAILFEQWLAERRAAATIEWYWGNAARTSLVGRPGAA